jgi:hypothetical protein
MPDEVLNIRVTERELDLIMDLLHEAGNRTDANGQPAIEICHDLMEQSARPADWADDLEPTEIDEDFWHQSAEEQMFQAGIDAREQAKESSHAAARRQELLDSETRIFSASVVIEQLSRAPASVESEPRSSRFGEFELNGSASMAVHKHIPRTVPRMRETKQREMSDTQRHDLWEKPANDPADW